MLGLRRGFGGRVYRRAQRRRPFGSSAAGGLSRRFDGVHDRLGDTPDRLVAETGGAEELLGAVLGAPDDRGRLRPRPLERLLDLGAGGVRQLGRLVTGLLEQPAPIATRPP